MSLKMDSVSLLNPKLSHSHASMPSFNKVPLRASSTFRFSVPPNSLPPPRFLTLHLHPPNTTPFILSSKPREIEVENEEDEPRIGSEESQEAWKQALDTFTEQASKIQCVSQEAYELYSKKAIIILKDTTEQLKIHAENARHELSVAAKEISEEGKEYLTTASENSPEVKEIVETFTAPTDDLNEISQVRDFYVGIPYGFVLSLGGFVSFMVTGSITAIRFGLILGGVLLALSISSLRTYKRGEPSPLALKGQAAIASILFLRELSLLAKGSYPVTYFTALISGAVVAFYVYRMVLERKQPKGSNLESGAEN